MIVFIEEERGRAGPGGDSEIQSGEIVKMSFQPKFRFDEWPPNILAGILSGAEGGIGDPGVRLKEDV